MCWIKKNRQNFDVYKKQETPPEAPISEEAVAVVWSEDKKSFGEIFYRHGAYTYSCFSLDYDEDFIGYYWNPVYTKTTSLFDTLEKAKQAAEDTMQGK